jgi:hypothetical protein
MSKSRQKKRNAHPPAAAATRRRVSWAMIVILAVTVTAVGALWWDHQRTVAATSLAPAAAGGVGTNEPAVQATREPGFAKLKGKWLRPDGGYVIEIGSVEPGGKLEVAYFNPQSIHVAKAQASAEGAATKVFIELRDVNYPGSTYDRVYDAGSDQLTGIYYQAALKQRFEVAFVRMQ